MRYKSNHLLFDAILPKFTVQMKWRILSQLGVNGVLQLKRKKVADLRVHKQNFGFYLIPQCGWRAKYICTTYKPLRK